MTLRAGLTVFALWAAGLGAAAQFGKISVLYQSLEGIYPQHTGVGIGLMVSVVGMVGLIFGTTAGLLVARIGARRAILAALVLGALVSFAQSIFPPYAVMMASRIAEGASHLAIVVVGPVAMSAVAGARFQGAALTLWSSFFGVTYAVLGAFGPDFVADFGAGALFGAHGIWMLAVAALLAVLMPSDLPSAPSQLRGGILAQHLRIYASARIAAPAMGFVCYTITYVALLTLLPGLVATGWGAFIGIAMPLVSIVVSLTLGVWLLSYVRPHHLVQGGFAVAVLASFGLWAFWGDGAGESVFALIIAASLGIVQGASFASIPALNAATDDRAEAAGAIAQLGNLGTTLGTPLLAVIVSASGAAGLAAFVAGFSALGIALHSLQARRRKISG